jgi:hypothetical protein
MSLQLEEGIVVSVDHGVIAPFGVLLAASLVIQPGRARSLCFHLGLTIHGIFCGCRGSIANVQAKTQQYVQHKRVRNNDAYLIVYTSVDTAIPWDIDYFKSIEPRHHPTKYLCMAKLLSQAVWLHGQVSGQAQPRRGTVGGR